MHNKIGNVDVESNWATPPIKLFEKDYLERLSTGIKTFIQNRTFKHKNKDGNDFEPYSNNYAKLKGVSADAVDLYTNEKVGSGGAGTHMLDVFVPYCESRDDKELKDFNLVYGDIDVSLGWLSDGKVGGVTAEERYYRNQNRKNYDFWGLNQEELNYIVNNI